MARTLSSDLWQPVGVTSLEPTALETVLSSGNRLVVAGPGAGKTELLAQRACYLLQTGACKPHRQILAISFKRDAAANLQERVRRRCGDELARRFWDRAKKQSQFRAGSERQLARRGRQGRRGAHGCAARRAVPSAE